LLLWLDGACKSVHRVFSSLLPQDYHPVQVKLSPTNVGAVKISNSAFWGPSYQVPTFQMDHSLDRSTRAESRPPCDVQVAVVEGQGVLSLSNSVISNWDVEGKGLAAIEVREGGSSSGLKMIDDDARAPPADLYHLCVCAGSSAIIIGNDFQQGGDSAQARFVKGSSRVVMTGNVMAGSERIVDEGARVAKVGYNAAEEDAARPCLLCRSTAAAVVGERMQ
jgi:hypothetical protein